MSIKNDEINLYKEWSKHLNQDYSEFCPNGGLLFRGSFFTNPSDDSGMYTWNRKEGDEENLWKISSRRIMILTKDLNDKELWDIRRESGGRNKTNKQNISEKEIKYSGIGFYRKLTRWVYGIYNSTCSSYIPFNQVEDYRKTGVFYEQVPLVRINCKQTNGGSRITNTQLSTSIQSAQKLLIQQIKIYEPNIILCCGYNQNEKNTGNIILNFIIENIYPDLELIPNTEEWCYYSKNNNIIAINSYHPTATIDTDRKMYEDLIRNFSKALCYQRRFCIKK